MFLLYLGSTVHDFIRFSEVNTFSVDRSGIKADVLFEYTLTPNIVQNIIKRKVWNFLDLFSVLGGIASVLSVFFAILFIPFADHNFVLKAIESLYVCK